MGVSRKQSTPNFLKNQHLLPPDTHMYVCISGGKKCPFFGKFVCFVFLKHLLWDSSFCFIIDELKGFWLNLCWMLEMFMSTVSFIVQLTVKLLCLLNILLSDYDLNCLKSWYSGLLSFLISFLICFSLFSFSYILMPCNS